MAYILDTAEGDSARAEAVAAFRKANKALPLSGEALILIPPMLAFSLFILAIGWHMGGLRGIGAMAVIAILPLSLVGFVLYCEKVIGKRPDRTLVFMHADD